MGWYIVTKKIHGRYYDYWQKTYRIKGTKIVKTLNKYIGPSHGPRVKIDSPKTTAAHVAQLPAWHRDLRKRFDNGELSKIDYLELIAEGPHVHKFEWQLVPDEEGNTFQQCECGAIGEIDKSNSSYFSDPMWHEEHGMGYTPEYFCKRCEKSVTSVDWEGKCSACAEGAHFVRK